MEPNDITPIELVVFNFTRHHYEEKYDIYIPESLKDLIIEFLQKIFASNILSWKQDTDFFQLLRTKLMDKISDRQLKLIYRASEHNFTAKSFHNECDGHVFLHNSDE